MKKSVYKDQTQIGLAGSEVLSGAFSQLVTKGFFIKLAIFEDQYKRLSKQGLLPLILRKER